MGDPTPKKLYLLAENMEMEEVSFKKLEFHSGDIYAMAGRTLNHSL